MSRTVRCFALFFGFAALVAVSATRTEGQDKKDKKGPTAVVESTEKSGKKWSVWQAKTGLKIVVDKDYVLSAVPKEMVGSTFLTRESPELGKWLLDGSLKAKGDLTAYAMIMTKARGKEQFGEDRQKALIKEGWSEVDGKVGTTFPSGEAWEWKAFKKSVDDGEIYLQLKDLSWDKHGAPVLFFSKTREKEKAKP